MCVPLAFRFAPRILMQQAYKLVARDFAGSQSGQMGARDLTVDELDVAPATLLDQACQRDLGGVALDAEHGFAEKDLPQLDSVQAAHQHALMVRLDRVPKSKLVQLIVGADHVFVEPCIGSGTARRGAGADGCTEGMVEARLERAIAERFAEAP